MKVLEVLDAELVLVDLEVNLGKNKQNSPTLCARYKGKLIPLSTPDGRPILMKEENALNWPQNPMGESRPVNERPTIQYFKCAR